LVIDTEAAIGVHSDRLQTRWTQLLCPPLALDGDIEMQWLDAALEGQATAALWTGQPGLVAPLSYRRHAQWDAACADSAARGWPVRLRRSGGGVVPQGPGILNVTLAYPCPGAVGNMAERVYGHLCQVLVNAMDGLGIATFISSVKGSFCDGRFNLAVNHQGRTRKIAGTAQYWRRANGRQAVLAHALLIVTADPLQLSTQANQFEAALNSDRQYDANALTSVAQCWSEAHPGSDSSSDLSVPIFSAVTQHIAASLIHQPA
jgi:lipoate-protein ligase A